MLSHTGDPEDEAQEGDSTFSLWTPSISSAAQQCWGNWALEFRFLTPTDDFPAVPLLGGFHSCLGGVHPLFLSPDMLQFSLP